MESPNTKTPSLNPAKIESTVFLSDLGFDSSVDPQKMKELIRNAFPNPSAILEVNPNKSIKSGSYFATVTLKSKEDANSLINKTITVNGRNTDIERYSPFSEGGYQIYIKDSGSLARNQLESYFSKFGQIQNIHIFKHQENEAHDSCTIKFVKDSDAESALKSIDHNIAGQIIRLSKFISKEDKKEQNKLYIKNIPWQADKKALEAELTKEFEKYGSLVKPIEVAYKDFKEKKGAGTALAWFQTHDGMEQAMQKFNRKLIGGDEMTIEYFLSKKEREAKGMVYVSNLNIDATNAKITEVFSQFGKVEQLDIHDFDGRYGERTRQGRIIFENKQAEIEALAEAAKQQNVKNLFVKGYVKINIYLDKISRQQMQRATKPINSKPPTVSVPPYPFMMPPTGIPTGIPGGIPTGLASGMPTGIPGGLPTGIPGGIPGGVPGSMSGIPGSGLNSMMMASGPMMMNPRVGAFGGIPGMMGIPPSFPKK